MSKIIEVIESLPDLISVGAATKMDVIAAENDLALQFSEEYKEYLYKFGAVLADDTELTGIAKSKNRNVICVTQREWEMNPLISHDLYVVENIGIEGIIIWQDAKGKVYQSLPNKRAEYIAESLADYLASK